MVCASTEQVRSRADDRVVQQVMLKLKSCLRTRPTARILDTKVALPAAWRLQFHDCLFYTAIGDLGGREITAKHRTTCGDTPQAIISTKSGGQIHVVFVNGQDAVFR